MNSKVTGMPDVDADFEDLAGEDWQENYTVTNNHNTNVVLTEQVSTIQTILATGGVPTLQKVEITAPITAVAGLNKLQFLDPSITGTPSNNTDVLTVDTNFDQVVLVNTEPGYSMTGNFEITKTTGSPQTHFSIIFYLFDSTDIIAIENALDNVTVSTATPTGSIGTESKTITFNPDSVPLTPVVYYQIQTGGGTIDKGEFTVLSLFGSSATSPSPEETTTITVADWAGGTTVTKTCICCITTDTIIVAPRETLTDTVSRTQVVDNNVRAYTDITVNGQLDFVADTTPTEDITFIIKKVV